MYPEVVPVVRCPNCTAHPLTLLGPLYEDGEIVVGALRCEFCAVQTPIREGIWDALNDRLLPLTPAQITNYLPPAARLYEPLWRWNALTLMSGRRFPLREELTLLRGLIQPRPDRFYLDVACSAGLYARTLAAPGAIVAAVDHSWAMLREARRQARERGLRISYMRASAQALPVVNGAAAGVVMGGSLNEIGDQHAALCEIRRVLEPDGQFFCMNLVKATSGWGRVLQSGLSTGGVDFPKLATLNQWFDRAGLRREAQWRWRVVAITLLQLANLK
ncbi:MAG: class I SAM-dependent methyltransferase [Chloroflexi bacterium]|nr:class I SAM-dependent methyltransferase [Chloroflexota bacterium]